MLRTIEEAIDAKINRKTLAATFAVLAVMGAKDVSDENRLCSLLEDASFVTQQADVIKYRSFNILPAKPIMCD